MPRKRTLTARRTTTEEVTITEEHDNTLPGARFAPGWLDVLPDEVALEQRRQQAFRCLDLLWLHAASMAPDADLDAAINAAKAADRFDVFADLLPEPEALKEASVTVLRAGPGATPLELEHGRTA